jgi:hypothetical protein
MGYLHIDNLYKNQEIMLFKEAYALEKIHGTSAHVKWHDTKIVFFPGGVSHSEFVGLFEQGKTGPGDVDMLKEELNHIYDVTIYGEAYGGKCQKMSNTYGKDLAFVAFDVNIDGNWLSVPQAEEFVVGLGIEFVEYEKIPTEIEEIDRCRDKDSTQAIRNGMGEGKKREGVVLRPLIELTKNNDGRIISKHKGDDFKETKTPRKVSPEKLQVLEDAKAIAEEWVVAERIRHVLDKIPNAGLEKMREIIAAMQEDVKREAEGEIVWTPEVAKAVGKATAIGVKKHYQGLLR